MTSATLREHRILVAEDEYVLAIDLAAELEAAGAIVVGPVSSVTQALDRIEQGDIDGAILDVNLRGQMIYPAADLLLKNDLPFVFATGYDETAIPDRFARVVRCEKPVDMTNVAQAIGNLMRK